MVCCLVGGGVGIFHGVYIMGWSMDLGGFGGERLILGCRGVFWSG